MKRFAGLTIGLLMMIGLLLSGCGGSGSSNATAKGDNGGGSGGSGSNGKTVTITLWNRISRTLFDQVTQDFEKKYPNIKVNIVDVPASDKAKAQYQAAVSQNSLPDLYINEKYSLPQFVKLGQAHNLDEVFTPEVKKDYLPSAWTAGDTTLNGHVYKMPVYSSLGGAYMLFYNKKVLQKYGINNIPKTWNDLITVGKKIYQKSHGKVYGLMMGAQSAYVPQGGALAIARTISPDTGLNYKTGKYNYATDGMVQTFQFFKKLMDQKVLDPGSLSLSDVKAIPIFTTGRAAFLLSGNWAGGIMKSESNFSDFGVAFLPTKSANDRKPFQYITGGGQGLLVSKYTKHWPQVKLYMQYLEKHLYAQVVKEGRQDPPKKRSNITEDVTSVTPHYKDITKIMEEMAVQQPNPIARNTAAWQVTSKYDSLKPQGSVGKILVGYLSGKVKDPKAALEQLSKGDNQAFNKALQSFDKVSIKDYQFPNWVPGKPYTQQ